ncbi:hypothetical protein [Lysinibacillus fusiformis]|uniref:hypothetical protein n=1 Tax=Lysinibacillus fusiformis TaxID=28031 RepID=UPI000D3351C3|nr:MULTISPECIES: hypothetical protein [Lysinibacillus]MED4668038.1 hypothetical protein [Lysinibacillus fusiformis]QAS58453.1 hypothetical protein LSP_20085 [Lysinibacillus sphaericus]RDV35549.1 hypothetical protein C7B90_03030 [Lysinibacillus fusiformis]GED64313.1 hypothetical protein LFU01_27650 [Lysinibacillus fusiformis]
MRKVRGVVALVEYLQSINCPIGKTTIYNLMRSKNIPFNKPAPGVLLFDLDEIDSWLGGDSK